MELIPTVRCKIAGTGGAEPELRSYIDQRGLKNVELLGFVEGKALHTLIRESSCTLVPSEWYENCPMSVLESMALGRSVIGTRIGGIPELIRHEEDGMLVDPAEPEQLASAIERLCSDSARAEQMGMAARRKVEKEFSASRHYTHIAQVYSELIG